MFLLPVRLFAFLTEPSPKIPGCFFATCIPWHLLALCFSCYRTGLALVGLSDVPQMLPSFWLASSIVSSANVLMALLTSFPDH